MANVIFNLTTYRTIQVESMPVHTTGGAGSGGWWLWANGYVAQDITVTQDGVYLFSVAASGTPVQGGWPQMSLQIDGRVQDTVTVPSNQIAFYTLNADLAPGVHQLAIAFDNDAYAPPEDRNLFLDQIRWGRESDNSPTTFLTRPGAVVQTRRGTGRIILDEIAWESESQNATKAGRFASTLLTGLGAAMRLPPAVRIPAVTMRNVNVDAYSVVGDVAWLNSNGRIEATVLFTTPGTYAFEVVAGGTIAQGVLPRISLLIDGSARTNFYVTATAMTSYKISVPVTAGTHAVGLGFLNDLYAPPQDRNAAFGSVTITLPPPPRIAALYTDPELQAATAQCETTPGGSYEMQTASHLPFDWHPVQTFTSSGNIASWRDTGEFSGSPPLTLATPQRFYRLRQTGP